MRTPRHRLAPLTAAVLAAMLSFPGLAGAQVLSGWSQFQGGPDRAGAVQDGPAPGFRTAWEVGQETGGPRNAYGLSAPVVGEGTVVATGPTAVFAVDAVTGDPAWTVDRALGPSTAPALVEGTDGPLVVFTEGWGDGPPDVSETPSVTASASVSPGAGSDEGDDASEEGTVPRLVAVPVGGGAPVWSVELPDVSRTGVTITGTVAIVGSIDGTVTAVETGSGTVTWTVELGGYLEGAIGASDDLVLVPLRGDEDTTATLVALSTTDGGEAWRYEPQTGSLSVGPPAIGDDSAFVTLPDGTVRAVSLGDGTERWRATLNAYVNPFAPASPPVLADDAVLVVDVRGQLYRLDPETGARTWDHAYNHPVLRSTPVVIGDHVVLATTDARVAAFDLATGELVWEGDVEAPGDEASSSALRSMAVAGDTLVIVRGGVDAGLVGLANDPDQALIRQVSPTVFDLPALLLAWLAALGFAALLFVGGRLLWSRLGPAEIPVGDDLTVEDA